MRLGLPATPRNCIPRRGISVLEKLVKTCPVWLQLGLGQAEAARILQRELAGMFLVCRDSSLKRLVLCVHFPSLKDSSPEVLEYPIREEKSSKLSPHLLPSSSCCSRTCWPQTLHSVPVLKLGKGKSFFFFRVGSKITVWIGKSLGGCTCWYASCAQHFMD